MNIPTYLLDNRSNPEWREKLQDFLVENNEPRFSLGWLQDFNGSYYNINNNNYYNTNNNNNYNTNNNNYYNINNNNYYNYYNYYHYSTNALPKGLNMKEGLKAVAVPFGYTITWIVGWLERVQGDEYTMKNARRVKSLGSSSHEEVIKNGCSESDYSDLTEYELHRLQILISVVPGDNWLAICPKPS